jgi:hypothetical protein
VIAFLGLVLISEFYLLFLGESQSYIELCEFQSLLIIGMPHFFVLL